MGQATGGTEQNELAGEDFASERGADFEARVAQELRKHSDVDYSWGKWYCECGDRLRNGHTEFAAHQKEVEQKLREEAPRG